MDNGIASSMGSDGQRYSVEVMLAEKSIVDTVFVLNPADCGASIKD